MLTDSGGYQVFSLEGRRRITEAGVHFQSHLDGSARFLSPESAVDIQAALGSDIAMVFDECLAYPAEPSAVAASVELTLRWARRGRARMLRFGPARTRRARRHGVAAGRRWSPRARRSSASSRAGCVPELRVRCRRRAPSRIGFEAYAIGGLSVGEPIPLMYDIVDQTTGWLPADRPRYLMGVGTPADLVEAVARGVDMFDCVLPTRNARNGQLFTRDGKLNIKNAQHAEDDRPVDEECRCYTCRTASPGVPAAPLRRRRDDCRHPQHHPQHPVLP